MAKVTFYLELSLDIPENESNIYPKNSSLENKINLEREQMDELIRLALDDPGQGLNLKLSRQVKAILDDGNMKTFIISEGTV